MDSSNPSLSPLDANMSTAGVALSSADMANLRTAGKWGKFIAIVGFVFLALFVIMLIFFGSAMVSSYENLAPELALGSFVLVFYGISIAISIYPLLMLYRFSTNIIAAADSGSPTLASGAFKALKNLFVFYGIVTALVIGLYALMFVVGGIAMVAGMG